MAKENSDPAVKYVYRAPEFPAAKPAKLPIVVKIASYLVVAVVFLLIGVILGQNPGLKNQGDLSKLKPASQSQSSITFAAAAKGAIPKDEQLTINQDGKVSYRNNLTKKEFKTQISADKLQTITNQIMSANFFQLNSNYSTNCGTCLTYTITVKLGTNSKTVRTEWGAKREPTTLSPLITSYERLIAEFKQAGNI